MRIVSLLPSVTDIVCSLGAGESIVGCTPDCDKSQLHAEVLFSEPTRRRAGSHDAKRVVDSSLPSGQDLYTLDTERLTSVNPDVVLAPASAGNARVSNLEEALTQLADVHGVTIERFDPLTVEDVLDDVLRVGQIIGLESQAEAVVGRLRSRLFRAQEYVTPFDARAPVVGLLTWVDPLMVAGHWQVQIVERAGAVHPWNPTRPAARAGAAAGPQQAQRHAGTPLLVSSDQFWCHEPDWVLVAPCGVELSRAQSLAEGLVGQNQFARWARSHPGRLWALDGRRTFNRPGPTIVDDLEWLVSVIHARPELRPPGYPGVPVLPTEIPPPGLEPGTR
ncbi:MAG: hypothetical protein D6695_01420 [Planctomycetota bacterium]|nr:MAG: hypothetical protein D6695_01420 [Planctomycetota bacterium]